MGPFPRETTRRNILEMQQVEGLKNQVQGAKRSGLAVAKRILRVREFFMALGSVHTEVARPSRTFEGRTIEWAGNYLLAYGLSPLLQSYSPTEQATALYPLPRVITTRSTMGGNHRRLFTATSSSRQLISVAVIPVEEATRGLPMDEHKSPNPRRRRRHRCRAGSPLVDPTAFCLAKPAHLGVFTAGVLAVYCRRL